MGTRHRSSIHRGSAARIGWPAPRAVLVCALLTSVLFLLSVAPAWAARDGYEPDNLASRAAVLTVGGPHQSHTIEPEGDVDHVSFWGEAGRVYVLDASQTAGLGVEMIVQGPGLDEEEFEDVSRAAFRCTEDGTFTAELQDWWGDTGAYEVWVERGGMLVGTVTGPGGSPPVEGVRAESYKSDHDDEVSQTTTDSGGRFELPTKAGQVKLEVSSGDADCGYLGQWYNNASGYATATDLTVPVDGTSAATAVRLSPGAKLTGHVYTTGSLPLENVYVSVWGAPGSKSTQTDASGAYDIKGLASGGYKMRFDAGSTGFVSEYYDDTRWATGATTVTVAAPNTVTPAHQVKLAYGAWVRGRVVDSGGNGVEGMWVIARDNHMTAYTYGKTDSQGYYRANGLPTDWTSVQFYGWWSDYLTGYYLNQPESASPTWFMVTQGQGTQLATQTVTAGGRITGRVTDEHGFGMRDVSVYLRFANTGEGVSWAWGQTDADGYYSVRQVPDKDVVVVYEPPWGSGYAAQYYDGASSFGGAGKIRVPPGELRVINQSMQPLLVDAYEPDDAAADASRSATDGTSSSHTFTVGDVDFMKFQAEAGVLYRITTGNMSANMDTVLTLYDTACARLLDTNDNTGLAGIEGGASAMDWLAPADGDYYVLASAASRWYTGSYKLRIQEVDRFEVDDTTDQAKSITTDGAPQLHMMSKTDFDYVKFSATAGTTYTAEAMGAAGDQTYIRLDLFDSSGNWPPLASAGIGSYGETRFTWTAPADGVYYLRAKNYSNSFNYSGFYELRVCTGSGLRGRTLDSTLGAIGGIPVTIFRGTRELTTLVSDTSTGEWSTVVMPGDYRLRFGQAPSWPQPPVVAEWYENEAGPATAESVHVDTGTVTNTGDETLARTGQVSGHTYGPANTVVMVGLIPVSPDARYAEARSYDPSGHSDYVIDRVMPGQYKAYFYNQSIFEWQHYKEKRYLTQAETITVNSGETVAGIDATVAAVGADAFEYDSSVAAAKDITFGAVQHHTITSGYPGLVGDKDYMKFSAVAGRTYRLRLAVDSGLAPAGGIYNSLDVTQAVLAVTGSEPWGQIYFGCFWTAPTSGAYYVRVLSGSGPWGRGAYDVSLAQLTGTIRGRVTDEFGAGQPLWVRALTPTGEVGAEAQADNNGDYSLSVDSGTHRLLFLSKASPSPYIHEYFSNASTLGAAAPVSVGEGATLTGYDARLGFAPPLIEGRVVDESGAGITGVRVRVYRATYGSLSATATTRSDGRYVVPSLTSQRYRVYLNTADTTPTHYDAKWYEDGDNFAEADVVDLSTTSTVRGVDATLTASAGGDLFEYDGAPSLAADVVTGTAQSHTLYPAGDRDWARFTAQDNSTYTAVTSGLAGGADTVLYLYAGTDTESYLARDNDGGGGGGASRLVHHIEDGGPYYLKVAHAASSGTGRYELSLSEQVGPPLTWTSYQETSTAASFVVRKEESKAKFSRGWKSSSSGNFSGGKVKYQTGKNAYSTCTFAGKQITFFTTKGKSYGKAKIYVDRVYKKTLDLYSSSTKYKQPVYSVASLANKAHTIKVLVLRSKNRRSKGYRVDVDAFEALGGWAVASDTACSGGQSRYETSANAQAIFTFTGDRVAWLSTKGPDRGKAVVYLDGVILETVDLYAAVPEYQAKVFKRAGLRTGPRRLMILTTGAKNALSTGTRVDVDGFLTP